MQERTIEEETACASGEARGRLSRLRGPHLGTHPASFPHAGHTVVQHAYEQLGVIPLSGFSVVWPHSLSITKCGVFFALNKLFLLWSDIRNISCATVTVFKCAVRGTKYIHIVVKPSPPSFSRNVSIFPNQLALSPLSNSSSAFPPPAPWCPAFCFLPLWTWQL